MSPTSIDAEKENMTNSEPSYNPLHRLAAWSVHALTASTAVIGIYTLIAIYQGHNILALCLMGAAIVIDAVDGTFARLVQIKSVIPNVDGALLDNIVDYLNYVITPAFFLIVNTQMLPAFWGGIIVSMFVLASAYQFTQLDAKTPDHFFKGFPSYWNIVVFYLFYFNSSPITNSIVLITLTILVFVPIKYVYPSRLDYLSNILWLRVTMTLASILYGVTCALMLWLYPEKPMLLMIYTFAYLAFYLGFSLFRTFYPLPVEEIS